MIQSVDLAGIDGVLVFRVHPGGELHENAGESFVFIAPLFFEQLAAGGAEGAQSDGDRGFGIFDDFGA